MHEVSTIIVIQLLIV